MIKTAIALLLWGIAGSAQAQDKHDFAAGQLLTNTYGELCTMCEAKLVCTAADGAATSYAFQKRAFLSQMSTVFDYFPFTKSYGLHHTRPVTIGAGGRETAGKAAFDLTTKRIDLPNAAGAPTWIDRGDGSWHGADGSAIGRCAAP